MKNVHVLPTDKPSNLIESNLSLIRVTDEFNQKDLDFIQAKFMNLHITSDEEIKEGDWFLCLDNTKCNDSIYKCNEVWLNMEEKQPSYCKKIILTTDFSLAPDVQAIDDEFLEWFVKNPTYEEVYIIKQYKQVNQDNPLHKGSTALRFSHYEIHLLKATKQMIDEWNLIYCKLKSRQIPTKEEQTKCYCGHTTTCDCGPEEPKQETLEEIAERYYQDEVSINGFINGYKLAKEQTIDEVFEWLTTNNYLTDLKETLIKDFNNLKNK
jgi:hypothetical protein